MLRPGDTIFLGNRTVIEQHLWDERTFLVVEKCMGKTVQFQRNELVDELESIVIDDDDKKGDNDDGDTDSEHSLGSEAMDIETDAEHTQTAAIHNEVSVLFTPEYSPNTSPLIHPHEVTIPFTASTTRISTIDQGNALQGLVLSLC